MVATTPAARPRTGSSRGSNDKRSFASWVMIGVPVLLGLLFVWQLVSPLLRTEITLHTPVAVSRVSLAPDAQGSRVDMVIVDRSGSETTVNGDITIKVREPDGAVWQTTRTVSSADFAAVPGSGLLNGRQGYSIVVPAADWMRAPRHGGAATVTVTVQPNDGSTAFSYISEERFP